MSYLLKKDRQVLAGICWGIVMIKPHLGLLFFFPLLFGRKFLTIIVAIAANVLLSIPPSIMCGESPFTMVLDSTKANATGVFCGTFLIPAFLGIKASLLLPISMALGAVLSAIISYKIRDNRDWILKLSPVTLFVISWSYYTHPDLNLLAIPIAFVASQIILAKSTSEIFIKSLLLLALLNQSILYLSSVWVFTAKITSRFPLLHQLTSSNEFSNMLGHIEYAAMVISIISIFAIVWRCNCELRNTELTKEI